MLDHPLTTPSPVPAIQAAIPATVLAAILAAILAAGPATLPAQHAAAGARPAAGDPAAARHRDRQAAARREYHARAATLHSGDVVGHFALAEWAARRQLPRCARWELHEVLREAPDHAGARAVLGQAWHAGRWLPRAVAMRAEGRVLVDGKWLRKYEAAKLREARRRHSEARHRANLLLARLADPDPLARAAARRELAALAKTVESPELSRHIGRALAADDERFHAGCRHRPGVASRSTRTFRTGILTVRATQSKLLRMVPFTTSLGTGVPVRLQLPQVRTISIGTTVALPLDRGR